jgi:hypothetical protein
VFTQNSLDQHNGDSVKGNAEFRIEGESGSFPFTGKRTS